MKHIKKLVFLVLFMAFVMTSYTLAEDSPKPMVVNQSVSGAPEKGKYDLYELNIPSRGKLNMVLQHENLFDEKPYWTVELLAADLETVLQTFDSKGTDESYTANSYGLTSGKYFVKVYVKKACGYEYSDKPYTLTASFLPSDAWEIEWNADSKSGNNSQGTATSFAANGTISGTINNGDDEDFYKVDISKNGYVTLNLQHENIYKKDIYWKAALVDAKTREVVVIESAGTKTSVSSPQIGVTKGTYYVKVMPASKSTFSGRNYSVSLKFKKSSAWESEYNASTKKYNNSMGNANKVKVGKAIQGTLSSKTDKDFFTYDLKSPKNVQVKFSHNYIAKKSSYYVVTVYNSQLKKVLSFESKGINKNITKRKVLKKGKYFVRITSGKNYTAKPYKLTFK